MTVELPLPHISGRQMELYEKLKNPKSKEKVYNASGLMFDNGVALLQVDRSGYTLAVPVGDNVYGVNQIAAHNPMIKNIPMVVYGKSPAQKKQEKARRDHERLGHEGRMQAEKELRASFGQPVHDSPRGIAISTEEKRNYPEQSVL